MVPTVWGRILFETGARPQVGVKDRLLSSLANEAKSLSIVRTTPRGNSILNIFSKTRMDRWRVNLMVSLSCWKE